MLYRFYYLIISWILACRGVAIVRKLPLVLHPGDSKGPDVSRPWTEIVFSGEQVAGRAPMNGAPTDGVVLTHSEKFCILYYQYR
jgi:hypothetical protein